MADDITPDLLSLPWRVGTKNGRTLYANAGTGASREDVMIGVLDSPELAAEACFPPRGASRAAESAAGWICPAVAAKALNVINAA